MGKVNVNPPKTPVTKGSHGLAPATVPNVCKMPGPPAPFVPTPLPNIGRSEMSPDGYSTSVKMEGEPVAIQGASFKSMGDVASKGTGGGIVSNNVEGATKFVAPGSMNVKVEGKNVQLLGDAMTNNGGPSGDPPNAATTPGEQQGPGGLSVLEEELVQIAKDCEEEVEAKDPDKKKSCRKKGTEKHDCADRKLKEKHGKDNPVQVYSDGAFNSKTGEMIGKKNPLKGGVPGQVPRTRGSFIKQAIGFAASKGAPIPGMIQAMLKGKQFPDVVTPSDPTSPIGRGNTDKVYDFKFPCPKDKEPKWGPGQKQRYQRMLQPNSAPRMVSPLGVF